jgi:cytochrome d ubiquinol oxidase subunit I
VTGVLTTAQAASSVSAGMIGTTLTMYLTIYAFLIAAYISVLFHLANKGRTVAKADDRPDGAPVDTAAAVALAT